MKRCFIICLILLLTLCWITPGYCNGPMRKLGRGVWNMLTCYLELFNRPAQIQRSEGIAEGLTYGLWQGGCMMILRAAAGFFEVLTFPAPIPEGYQPILKDPEFFWPSLSQTKK